MEDSSLLREQITEACQNLEDTVHEFSVYCSTHKFKEKVVRLTGEWQEIFEGVQAKVMFPNKKTGNRQIVLKAEAGSKVNLHKMLPARFIYVIYGENQTETGLVINEDEHFEIQSLKESSMYFPVDTKIVMEVDDE